MATAPSCLRPPSCARRAASGDSCPDDAGTDRARAEGALDSLASCGLLLSPLLADAVRERWEKFFARLNLSPNRQVVTQKRQTHQHVEQIVEVPVPMTQEEVVHVPKIITQTRVQQERVEQMIEVPIPMQQEEVGLFSKSQESTALEVESTIRTPSFKHPSKTFDFVGTSLNPKSSTLNPKPQP